jgi:hypothetical protein
MTIVSLTQILLVLGLVILLVMLLPLILFCLRSYQRDDRQLNSPCSTIVALPLLLDGKLHLYKILSTFCNTLNLGV